MHWVLVAVVGWLLCSVIAAPLIGGAIGEADHRDRGRPWGPDGAPDDDLPWLQPDPPRL